jgi:hypothetical protein
MREAVSGVVMVDAETSEGSTGEAELASLVDIVTIGRAITIERDAEIDYSDGCQQSVVDVKPRHSDEELTDVSIDTRSNDTS